MCRKIHFFSTYIRNTTLSHVRVSFEYRKSIPYTLNNIYYLPPFYHRTNRYPAARRRRGRQPWIVRALCARWTHGQLFVRYSNSAYLLCREHAYVYIYLNAIRPTSRPNEISGGCWLSINSHRYIAVMSYLESNIIKIHFYAIHYTLHEFHRETTPRHARPTPCRNFIFFERRVVPTFFERKKKKKTYK